MAGLKKPSKRRDTQNPNTVIVLFLVFFVILSIGLGVWGYFGYAGQDELRGKTKDAQDKLAAAQLGENYYQFLALDSRLAMGHPVDADLKEWEKLRDQFFQDGGKFKGEATRPAMLKMIDDTKKDVGYDEANRKYASSYRDKLSTMKKNLDKALADLFTKEKELEGKIAELRTTKAKIDAFWKGLLAKIEEDNQKALKIAMSKSAEFDEAMKRNEDLKNQADKAAADSQAEKDKMNAQIVTLNVNLKKAKEQLANASSSIIRISSEPHALLLDISKGKLLWDEPLGKITTIDIKSREAVVNVGSSIGVKPGLTFNIFAPSWRGKAEGNFKGTAEVIQVLGPGSSRARITSIYDAQGSEIAINDPSRGRAQREVDNPLKEGDLVFNHVFGTHVVLAGKINWGDLPSDSPAAQMRHVRDFMHLLERQGVKVDAYLDLTDGKLKGNITSKTRFFVVGDPIRGEEGKKIDEDGKKINEVINAVRTEAIEKGMFIISAENLANVIGFRSPRSANSLETSKFRPALPFAGADR